MGEVADMMLDGTLCEGCGAYIDDDGGEGFPRYCSPECARNRGAFDLPPRSKARPFLCSCGKRCSTEQGLRDHRRAKNCR